MNKTITYIKNLWQERPLLVIIALAIAVRLFAVLFATGYGFHDDYFLVIQPAQGWLEGQELNHMLNPNEEGKLSGRSILYPFVHYVIFGAAEWVGITTPEVKMLLVRFLHMLFFVVGIRWAYQLTVMLSTKNNAKAVGIFMALFWMFPQLSVRTLVEVVPIPLMLLASVHTVKYSKGLSSMRSIWWAGVLLGICFSLRYQTLFFAGGMGLALLLMGRWKAMLALAAGIMIPIALIHGIGDFFICGFPFCKICYYVEYNIIYANSYITEAWYFYLLILLGVLLPPAGFLLMFGFFRAWKVDVVLWAGTLAFLVFHSIFPNKQERFVFTIIPHIMILGYISWQQFVAQSTFWQKREKLHHAVWILFWLMNAPLLYFYTPYANKQARTEGMAYLRERGDVRNFVLFDPVAKEVKPAPMFYLGQHLPYLKWDRKVGAEKRRLELARLSDALYPNYLIIMQKRGEDIQHKVDSAKVLFPDIKYLETVKMSGVDAFRNTLNKHLKLDDWVIFEIQGERTVKYQ